MLFQQKEAIFLKTHPVYNKVFYPDVVLKKECNPDLVEENSIRHSAGKKISSYSSVLVSVNHLWHVILLVLYVVHSAVMPLFCHFVRYVIPLPALKNMFSYEMSL